MTTKKAAPIDEPELPLAEGMFTAEEMAAMAAEAVELERAAAKKAAKAEMMKGLRLKARQRLRPGEALRPVLIDVAGYTDRIVLDGRAYMHGSTYQVTSAIYDSLTDAMQRTWDHEADVDGANRNAYRRPRDTVLNTHTGAVLNAPNQIM